MKGRNERILSGLVPVQIGLRQLSLGETGDHFVELGPMVAISEVDSLMKEDVIENILRKALEAG